jgi:hypothetical protein
MSIVLLGSSSGSVTLQEPAVAGSTVIDLPATSGTMAVLPTSTSVLPEASGGTGTTTGYYGFKNRIINGAMVIDQRNAGASVTGTAGNYAFPVDRFKFYNTASSKLSGQQSTDAPSGFKNSIVLTSLAATVPSAGDEYQLYHPIEGFNCADLGFGTASAKTVTLSFWTKSSLTGTFSGCISNAGVRSYVFTYTINSANTWEFKTITIAGDTTGTWNTGSSIGINILWDLGSGSAYNATPDTWNNAFDCRTSGSVNLIGTNGATLYITGVQLEKGATATSFDYRPYGTELALCQRYCINYRSADANGGYYRYIFGECVSTSTLNANFSLPVQMRVTPSVSTTGTASDYCVYSRVNISALTTVPTIGSDGSNALTVNINSTSSGAALVLGSAGALMSNANQTSFVLLTAEL